MGMMMTCGRGVMTVGRVVGRQVLGVERLRILPYGESMVWGLINDIYY